MNSKYVARKTLLAAAIAMAAAAPAFAASAPSEWAGYPSTDSVQFAEQPASLATTAPIAMRPAQQAEATVAAVSMDASTPQPATDAHGIGAMASPADTTGDMAAAQPEPSAWTVVVLPATTADMYNAAPATLPQWQQPAITRQSVQDDLMAARAAGTLTPANEVGDTERVLAARQAFNEHQTDAIVAEYQAEYDRQVALQEAEIRRMAMETDWLLYGMAQPGQAGSDNAGAEVQIDVISMQPMGVGE